MLSANIFLKLLSKMLFMSFSQIEEKIVYIRKFCNSEIFCLFFVFLIYLDIEYLSDD